MGRVVLAGSRRKHTGALSSPTSTNVSSPISCSFPPIIYNLFLFPYGDKVYGSVDELHFGRCRGDGQGGREGRGQGGRRPGTISGVGGAAEAPGSGYDPGEAPSERPAIGERSADRRLIVTCGLYKRCNGKWVAVDKAEEGYIDQERRESSSVSACFSISAEQDCCWFSVFFFSDFCFHGKHLVSVQQLWNGPQIDA